MKRSSRFAVSTSVVLAALVASGCPSRSPPAGDRPASKASASPSLLSEPIPVPEQKEATRDASSADAAPPWPPMPPTVASKWCTAPMHALDERTCYAVPEQPTASLLVYFHGLVPPSLESPQKENLFEVVARASIRADVAVLMPLGLAELAPEKKFTGWYGWPTRSDTYAEHAASLVARVGEARALFEAHVGRKFQRLYLAGSSSGAYFISALALRGDFPADGYGAFSGGSAQLAVEAAAAEPKPFYVGYGSYDGAKGSAIKLVEELKRRGWPVSAAEHRTGHGAREVYLDEAFALWQQAAK